MRQHDERRVLDWGHLLLLAFFAIVVLAYLIDARTTSLSLNNLLLVQPAAAMALLLIALVLPQIARKVPLSAVPDAAGKREKLVEVVRVLMLAAAFGTFVLSLETVGFDVATFVFVAVGLFICGERRLWLIALYATVFTLLVVKGYQQLVPFPFPTSFL